MLHHLHPPLHPPHTRVRQPGQRGGRGHTSWKKSEGGLFSTPLHLSTFLMTSDTAQTEEVRDTRKTRSAERQREGNGHTAVRTSVCWGGGDAKSSKTRKKYSKNSSKKKKKKKAQNEKIIFHFVLCSKSKTETGRSSCRRTREDTRGLTEDAETLRLEDALQRREVDDEQLPHDGGQDGETERAVAAQPHLVDHPGLRSRDGHS